ncbi:transcriptional regulator [Alcaligenes faecalis]|uniref:helix-turn-helix transcriptional regulator n=1 Tax=Alcaligenes faecalis TaxID=511 RepID=UPI000A2D292F|nr:YafY family protein [Alcaligenes faecalis]KAA1286840.1 YafY family transcriptional regulator [Alcaligenes faecalis]OSZ33600.1 transcriptional regulator [Alcaligenes faecalis]OSZ47477.1 transcriptional regulator [Alcaligenes faecalis]
MARAERLLSLLQVLRRHKRPVSGARLAQELGISIRTLYRDMASLQAQGADIEGEPGVGYVLRPSFMLPPLMFSQAELEALILGFRWVEKFADEPLTKAAGDAMAKISAVLPDNLRDSLESTALRVGPRVIQDAELVDLGIARTAIRLQRKLRITYRDGAGQESERVIWPFSLGYFQHFRILVGWCELKGNFRHFRTDRIRDLVSLEESYPRHRADLFKQWRATQTVP